MKEKKVPMRRCVGCMQSKPKKELIRIVMNSEGDVTIDGSGKAQGRGVYLCPDVNCFNSAKKKKSIARSLGVSNIPDEHLDELYAEITEYYEKKN